MATTPAAPATPAPAPTRAPAPAPASPTILSPVARRPRAAARIAPPARLTYTRHATAGVSDDRIIANALNLFYKIMVCVGGVAILIWILFGGFKLGRATASVGSDSSPTVVYQPSPVPILAPPMVQPAPPPRELTPEERAEQYKEERRRQYGIR